MSLLDRIVERLRRSLRNFIAGVAALLAVGCVSTSPVITGDTPQARAGNAIAQAEIALVKGYRLVADQAAAGVLFKSELQEILGVLDKASAAVDTAKKFYNVGSFDDALKNALDADKALDYVEAEVAKKLRERRAPPANPVSWATPAAMTIEEKNSVCLYQAANFGQALVDALNRGAPPEKVRQAIRAPDPAMRARGEKLLDAILSRDDKRVEDALNDMVAYCVTALTKQEQVKV